MGGSNCTHIHTHTHTHNKKQYEYAYWERDNCGKMKNNEGPSLTYLFKIDGHLKEKKKMIRLGKQRWFCCLAKKTKEMKKVVSCLRRRGVKWIRFWLIYIFEAPHHSNTKPNSIFFFQTLYFSLMCQINLLFTLKFNKYYKKNLPTCLNKKKHQC